MEIGGPYAKNHETRARYMRGPCNCMGNGSGFKSTKPKGIAPCPVARTNLHWQEGICFQRRGRHP